MADPKNQQTPSIEATREASASSHRKFIESVKTRTFAPTAQLIIAWDGTQVICEAPGQGGAARDKIEGISFTDLPAPIQAALVELLSKAKAAKPAPTTADRPSSQAVRDQRIAEAQVAHAREWQKKFDAATWDEQQLMLFRRHQAELKRSQDIWKGLTNDHGMPFANKIIPAGRRPRRVEVLADGVRVSYKNGEAPKPTKKIGGKIPVSGSFDNAIEIDL
jgi:hypothetical protein